MGFDLERENDPETLRQAARLLEAENRRLVARVGELIRELLAAQGKDKLALQLELDKLQGELEKKNKMLFAPSSERRTGDDGVTAEADSTDTSSDEKAPARGHGRRQQKNLRVIVREHTLDEADRACTTCGGTLSLMGDQVEESEEIDVIAREFVIRKHVRRKYRCACGACVETAPAPRRLLRGGRYSIGFAIAVAISKYADHLPLERQARIMKREGLEIDSQTLYDQIEALARLVWPAYDRLGASLLEEPLLFVDETPWPLLGKAQQSTRWHAWVMASLTSAYYEIHDTRGIAGAKSLLAGFRGIGVTDGYVVYDALAARWPHLRLAACWAHIRRKFVDAESAFPKETEHILALIRDLYAIEARPPPGSDGLAERHRLRNTESRAVLARIQDFCRNVQCTPGSRLALAIDYMTGLWSKATLFLDHARVPLDNNTAERALRGLVLGRKNHYGSKSRRGTEVAAVFYSLIESAKLSGVEPARYLRIAIDAALDGREPPLPFEVAISDAAADAIPA